VERDWNVLRLQDKYRRRPFCSRLHPRGGNGNGEEAVVAVEVPGGFEVSEENSEALVADRERGP